jgi:mannose-1-phosphate guanylyltransferase
MKAILMAAGYGTRLLPITEHTPKCLVKIKERYLLDIWIEMLVSAGIRDILINTHYLHEKVELHIEKSKFSENVKLKYEKKLLGTAGTLVSNKDFYGNEAVLMAHADNLSLFKMEDFISAHLNRPAGCELTMMTFNTTYPSQCGIISVDENGIVVNFEEKPKIAKSNLANAAIYILEPEFIKNLELGQKNLKDFSTEVIPLNMGKIATFHNNTYHRDIGSIESLKEANLDYPN